MDVEAGRYDDSRLRNPRFQRSAQPLADTEGPQTPERRINGRRGLCRVGHVNIPEQQGDTLQESLEVAALDALEGVFIPLAGP